LGTFPKKKPFGAKKKRDFIGNWVFWPFFWVFFGKAKALGGGKKIFLREGFWLKVFGEKEKKGGNLRGKTHFLEGILGRNFKIGKKRPFFLPTGQGEGFPEFF